MSKSVGFRSLPSVDRVLSQPPIRDLVQQCGHDVVAAEVREALASVRRQLATGAPAAAMEQIVQTVLDRSSRLFSPGPHRVINGSGVIIHTNLGRAPLCDEAATAMLRAARGYSDLEFQLETGQRGSRYQHVEELLSRATGAEAAMVVNNNASAVLLVLSTLAVGREVLVSRSQAVEIGGGFRIPDVLRQSGAKLVEVGTTNRTYLSDYENAMNDQTALLLRVHTSNFRIVGFVHEVTIEELAELGRRRGLPVVDDVGSGCLLDVTVFGLAAEPTVQRSISSGASLVCFSGDKLLGGPQAGIIVGQRQLVDRLKSHPLTRAIRIDKASLAALAATILPYLKGEATERIPIWQMISATPDSIRVRVAEWARRIGHGVSIAETQATIGGGSLPEETLPSFAICLDHPMGALELSRRLRIGAPPVIAVIDHDRVFVDGRTVLPGEDDQLVAAVQRALSLR